MTNRRRHDTEIECNFFNSKLVTYIRCSRTYFHLYSFLYTTAYKIPFTYPSPVFGLLTTPNIFHSPCSLSSLSPPQVKSGHSFRLDTMIETLYIMRHGEDILSNAIHLGIDVVQDSDRTGLPQPGKQARSSIACSLSYYVLNRPTTTGTPRDPPLAAFGEVRPCHINPNDRRLIVLHPPGSSSRGRRLFQIPPSRGATHRDIFVAVLSVPIFKE